MIDQRGRAEEDLRIIRALMERATIYRAISAPTALVGGVVSVLAAGAIYWNNEVHQILRQPIRGRAFAAVWLVALVLTLAANSFFIWREASNSGRPFISSGMKLALGAIAPCMLIPLFFTYWFCINGYLGGVELELVLVWIVFYGLALLSTALFAPRSLVVLGWAFLLSGLSIALLSMRIDDFPFDLPLVAMVFTFGLYHLIYAAFTWPRRSAAKAAQPAVE